MGKQGHRAIRWNPLEPAGGFPAHFPPAGSDSLEDPVTTQPSETPYAELLSGGCGRLPVEWPVVRRNPDFCSTFAAALVRASQPVTLDGAD